jgi:GT2 family glycosyltransferase
VDAPAAPEPAAGGSDGLAVSVVIPSYNRREQLLRTLSPLLRDPDTHEIVVVIDGGTDGSLEAVEALAAGDRRVRALAVPNGGQRKARLEGARAATGDVVLFLDDDVVPAFGLAKGHGLRHAERPGLVVLGYMPIVLPARRRRAMYPSYLYASEYERRAGDWERDASETLRGFWAGNHSLRREDFLAVMAGDTPPLTYHDDLDFGLRCLAHGLEGRFDRSLLARHEHRRDPAGFERDAARSGADLWQVHRRHPAAVPEPTPRRMAAGLPLPARALLAAAATEPGAQAVRGALRGFAALAGRLGLFRAEELAGEMLRRCVQQAGIAQARRADGAAA